MRQFYDSVVTSPWFYAAIFGVIIFILKYPFDFFWASYDPFYHAVHSQSYIDGFKITYPEFTYFSKYPSDPWFLYHILIGVVYFVGNFLFDITPVMAVSVFQLGAAIVLVGTLLTFFKVFYLFLYEKAKPPGAMWYITTLLLLFSIFSSFSYRAFFFERPHVLMILLVVLGSIAVLRKQSFLLFVTSFLAPLTYSFSFFCFLPVVTIAIGHMITQRIFRTTETIDRYIVSTFFGFGLGVLAHPNTIGYILNGLIFHSFAIIQSVSWWVPTQVGKLPIPMEMLVMQERPSLLYPVLISGIFITLDIRRRVKILGNPNAAYKESVIVGFLVMSQILLFASLFVSRTVEYAIPYGVVTFVVLQPYVWNYFKEQTLFALENNHTKAAQLVDRVQRLLKILLKQKTSLRVVVFIIIFMVFNIGLIKHSLVKEQIADLSINYNKAALYLAENATKEKIILQSSFDTYPSLMYSAPELRYSTGMDARMTYLFSPRLSELNNAVFRIGECYKQCAYTQEQALDILIDEYDIGYILVKKDDLQEGAQESLDKYEHIRKTFTDSEDLITIYEVISPQ